MVPFGSVGAGNGRRSGADGIAANPMPPALRIGPISSPENTEGTKDGREPAHVIAPFRSVA